MFRFSARAQRVALSAFLGVASLGVAVAPEAMAGPDLARPSHSDAQRSDAAPASERHRGTGETPSLGRALSADGRLTATHGGFDASGYRMVLAPDGSPRFVAQDEPALAGNVAWDDRFGQVGASSASVYTVAVAGEELIIGGDFDSVDSDSGKVFNNLARWNGRSWQPLGTANRNGTNGPVHALVIDGTNVFAGGRFSAAGGAPANRIARWDGTSWTALGTGLRHTSNPSSVSVEALAVRDGSLYVGGYFNRAGAIAANSVARWDGTAWSKLGAGIRRCGYFDSPGHCYDSSPDAGRVEALTFVGTRLYAGGDFDMAGGALPKSLARWTGTAWQSVGDVVDGSYGGRVLALAADGGALYVGGRFTHVGGVAANSVARLAGGTWTPLAGGVHLCSGCGQATVSSLGVWNGSLFVGGDFYDAGSRPGTRYFASWSQGRWSAVGTGLDNQGNAPAELVSSDHGLVVVGPYFQKGGASVLSRVGRWNGTSWSGLGLGLAGSEYGGGYVNALATRGRNVYVGGYLGNAGSTPIRHVAHFDGSSWDPMAGGVNGTVHAVATLGTNVYVGGSFSQAGTIAASNIARWDGERWWAVGSGTSGIVRALLPYNGKLYAGGGFDKAGGVAADSVAVWDPTATSWSRLGGGAVYWYGDVYALAGLPSPNNHYLFIGGGFGDLGDLRVNGLVMFDTATPSTSTDPYAGYYYADVGSTTPGVTVNGGYAGDVHTLTPYGTSVFVGGDFDSGGDVASRGFARYDAVAGWSSPGVVGGDSPVVNAAALVGKRLYLTGEFTSAGDKPARNIASYGVDTGAWGTLGSGLSGSYWPSGEAVAQSVDGLYVGGDFSLAGTALSHNIGLYTGTAR